MGLLTVLAVTAVLVADLRRPSVPAEADTISGPYASLLESSVDLGPALTDHVQLTAALRGAARPDLLMGWAQRQGLSVRWRPGDTWAIVEGAATRCGGRLRRRRARLPRSARPGVLRLPAAAGGARAAAGGSRRTRPDPQLHTAPRVQAADAAAGGSRPGPDSQRACCAPTTSAPLRDDGLHRQGAPRSWSSPSTASTRPTSTCSRRRSTCPSSPPRWSAASRRSAAARRRWISRPSTRSPPTRRRFWSTPGPPWRATGPTRRSRTMMEDADRRYPGAVWSFSIGWGCDKLITAADLAPVRAALAKAHSERHHGVRRQRRPRRPGMQGRRRVVVAAAAPTTSVWTRWRRCRR